MYAFDMGVPRELACIACQLLLFNVGLQGQCLGGAISEFFSSLNTLYVKTWTLRMQERFGRR